jgi:hypothetical protein
MILHVAHFMSAQKMLKAPCYMLNMHENYKNKQKYHISCIKAYLMPIFKQFWLQTGYKQGRLLGTHAGWNLPGGLSPT